MSTLLNASGCIFRFTQTLNLFLKRKSDASTLMVLLLFVFKYKNRYGSQILIKKSNQMHARKNKNLTCDRLKFCVFNNIKNFQELQADYFGDFLMMFRRLTV